MANESMGRAEIGAPGGGGDQSKAREVRVKPEIDAAPESWVMPEEESWVVPEAREGKDERDLLGEPRDEGEPSELEGRRRASERRIRAEWRDPRRRG